MSTTSHDWSRFVVRINVNAPVEKLYQGWTTREGIEYWFLRFSEYKKAGRTVRENKELVEKGHLYMEVAWLSCFCN